jgi:hypothetical protein
VCKQTTKATNKLWKLGKIWRQTNAKSTTIKNSSSSPKEQQQQRRKKHQMLLKEECH